MLPPITVRQNDGFVRLRRSLLLRKAASHRRVGVERGEKVWSYQRNVFSFRRTRLADNRGAVAVHRKGGEGGNPAATFVIVGDGRTIAFDARFGVGVEYRDRRPESGNGKGRSRIASMAAKIVRFAPMQTASVTTAVAVKPGVFRSNRAA